MIDPLNKGGFILTMFVKLHLARVMGGAWVYAGGQDLKLLIFWKMYYVRVVFFVVAMRGFW